MLSIELLKKKFANGMFSYATSWKERFGPSSPDGNKPRKKLVVWWTSFPTHVGKHFKHQYMVSISNELVYAKKITNTLKQNLDRNKFGIYEATFCKCPAQYVGKLWIGFPKDELTIESCRINLNLILTIAVMTKRL